MLTVYAIPVSLYCAKLRILLRHKKLQWQEIPPPGGYGSERYKTVIASGNLPALLDGDLVLSDSEAIAEYLNEKYPDPPMLPKDAGERAKVRERSRFHDTRLEPALRTLFAHMGPAVRDLDLNQRQSIELSARLGQLGKFLEESSEAGQPGLLSLGDCGFPISFAWIDLLSPVLELQITWPDAVSAYREKVEAIEAVATEIKDYRPKLQAYLDQLEGS